MFNTDHEWIIYSCDQLGECYEGQHRYQDALELYGQLREKVIAVGGPDNPKVAILEKWIDWNRKKLGNGQGNVYQVEG